MPKRSPRRKSKAGNKPRLWIYLVCAALIIVVIWWIVKPELTEESTNEQTTERNQESGTPTADNTAQEPIRGEDPLDIAIQEAAQRLNIPPNSIRRVHSEDIETVKMPLDRSTTDLTFANMIVKGQVELRGGTLIRGTETGSKQVLLFKHDDLQKRYQVELFYDSSVYENRELSKTIAIVVDDFGTIGGELLNDFFSLNRGVSFAILPGQPNSVLTMQKAQEQGREVLIHVPMEPIGYPRVDPGPEAILVRMTDSEIERMLNRFIHQLPYCKGINNHMGSLATADEQTMERVMNVLREKGKYFLDSRTTNVSIAYQAAQKAHIPAYKNRIFLDAPDITEATFNSKLQQIIDMSGSNTNLIAITHCHNREKLNYLRRFIQSLEAAGFRIVPVSQLDQSDLPQIL